jgi:hypothetical protein
MHLHHPETCLPAGSSTTGYSIDQRIRAFLAGETNGEDVLHMLYDHILDEPLPNQLRALLKG